MRLQPLTDHQPKSLLTIAGRPFIFHQLEMLRTQGVERVVLCLGHLGGLIESAVRSARLSGLVISYSFDGDELLGTGGALKQALPLLGDEFFVMNGDSYLECSLERIRAAYQAALRPGLMTVLRNDNQWDKSNVLFRDGRLIAYDKRSPRPDMRHIDFGLSVLRSGVLSSYPGKVIDLGDIFRDLSLSGQLAGFEVAGRFYEIGSRQGLRDTEEFLSRKLGAA